MRIDYFKNYSISGNNNSLKYSNNNLNSVEFTGRNIKNCFLQKIKALLNSKFCAKNDEFVKEVKPQMPKLRLKSQPIEVKNQKKALHMFLRDENFSKKVMVKNPDDGSYEIYTRMFDAASHETRINADYYDIKGRLDHTTIYDHNGLMLSKYYVKINNPNDPILIRRKDFNVIGKLTREEIKYKNGDVTYIDYDDIYNIQTFKTVSSDGSSKVVKNTRYSMETWHYDKDGNQLEYNIIEY